MKRCSKCGRDYSDESLNFCLDDGTVLSALNDPQPTLRFASATPTDPKPTEVLRPQPSVPPVRQSNQSWSIYLIIGLVVLVFGTVVIALVVLVATNSPSSQSSTTNHDSSTASPSYSSKPSPSPTIDLSGTWRDVFGGSSEITQSGETFLMTANGTSCKGRYEATATGTITGTRIELVYQSTYSRGQCSGSVSSDGVRVTLTCTDSECGQFQSMSERANR